MLLVSENAHADARTEARRHFKAGMELIAKGRYDAAVEELKRANEILPHPNVTYNIGRAYLEAGNLEQAVAAFRDYVATDPPDRAAVDKQITELDERIAQQKAAAAAPTPAAPSPPTGEEPAPGGEEPKPPPPPKPVAAPTKRDTGRQAGQRAGADAEDIYEEKVVTASRGTTSPLDSPSSTTIITRQDIRLSGITRIPELLRRVAGMDVMQITGGDANVSMRGFNRRLANKLLVLVNGRSVYNDILGSTFWEAFTIDVDQIERIEIVRGPGSALYGADAFAGVVNIITIEPGEGKNGVRVGYGDHQQAYGSLWASGREGEFAYRASVGYTRYPRWTREVADNRTDIVMSDANQDLGAQNVRIDLRTTRRFGRKTAVDVGAGFARSELDIYGIGPFNDYVATIDSGDITVGFRTDHINAKVYYERFSATSSVNSNYVGHTLYEAEPLQNALDAEVEFVGQVVLPSLVQDIHAGLGYRLKDIDWSYLEADLAPEHHGSVFVQDTGRFGKHLDVVLSGRLDYVPYLKRIVPSPRGAIIIKPTSRQAIRISGSTAFRSPSFLESYLAIPIELPQPGLELYSSSKPIDDPDRILEPEQIVTAEVSYLNQQSDLFEYELTAYYQRVTNLIDLSSPTIATLSGKRVGQGGVNPATGRYTVAYGGWENGCDIYHVGGGEVGGRLYPIEGLDVFANYALNLSVQQRPTGCDVPDDRRTSRHKINVGVQVRTKPGVDGELTFHYQSAQAWREQVASVRGVEYRIFDLPGYTLVNARVGYRFLKDRADVSATVFNALAGVFEDPPQMHPFGNRIGRRFMGFFTYVL
jgi:iron complex outermembrane receptor protein